MLVYYWNVVLTGVMVIGAAFATYLESLIGGLISVLLWLAVASVVALIQLVIGVLRIVQGSGVRNWHYVYSALIVGVLYGALYLIWRAGYGISV